MHEKELLYEIKRLRAQVQKYQHDKLTGLKTRRDFDKYYSDIWYEHKEFGDRFILGMVDLNGLHKINRDEGFEEGDKFIIKTADTLKDLFEDSNKFRIGGDEFMLIKRGNDIDDFKKRLDKIENCETCAVSSDDAFETEADMFNAVDNGVIKKKKKMLRDSKTN